MPKRKLKNLAPEDLQAIGDVMGGLLDKQSGVLRRDLAGKEDLKGLEKRVDARFDEMKDYMDQGFESVMAGIDAVAEKLTEKEKFDRLLERPRKLAVKLG